MPIVKRRLDICGREREWEYQIEAAGHRYRVSVRQVGRGEPVYQCSCGSSSEGSERDRSVEMFFGDACCRPCRHIAEAQRDLSIARQAAAQMV